MTTLAIRQSGGACIVSLPKRVLGILGLEVGSELEITLDDNHIVLTPVQPSKKELTLKEVLTGSPKEKLRLTEEDNAWLGAKPKGKEI